MKFVKKALAFKDVMNARFRQQRAPIAIRWQLTNRCTHQCLYCNIWSTPSDELTTDQMKTLLSEAASMGTRRISFSGGDPLLRKDFGEIVHHAAGLGISCSINSNGYLIEQQLRHVQELDLVKLSLDGPREIHETQKGKGSFDRVMRAAYILDGAGVRFTFACTLTRHNIDHLAFVLQTAQEWNTLAAFQPLKELYRGVEDIDDLSPDPAAYTRAIRMLIDEKRSGNRHIRNSLRGLEHILHWPHYKPLACGAGKIFCMVLPDGRVTSCDRIGFDTPLPSALEYGFKGAFDRLVEPHCNGCGFCGALELNYLYNLKFDVLPIVNRISS